MSNTFVLSRLLWWRKQKEAATPAAPPAPPPVKLRHLQAFIATPEGSDEVLHLMANAMTPTSFTFQTSGRLSEGQVVKLQTLFPGQSPLRLRGRVHWLLLSPAGLRGEIRLEAAPHAEQILAEFLDRYQDHQR